MIVSKFINNFGFVVQASVTLSMKALRHAQHVPWRALRLALHTMKQIARDVQLPFPGCSDPRIPSWFVRVMSDGPETRIASAPRRR